MPTYDAKGYELDSAGLRIPAPAIERARRLGKQVYYDPTIAFIPLGLGDHVEYMKDGGVLVTPKPAGY
jgi:hypothetical protein